MECANAVQNHQSGSAYSPGKHFKVNAIDATSGAQLGKLCLWRAYGAPQQYGFRLDEENKTRNKNIQRTSTTGVRKMVRLARESLAFVSVASFVWMMCQVAQLAA
ncbi:cell division inhibitor SidA [Phenylobacterium sp.]